MKYSCACPGPESIRIRNQKRVPKRYQNQKGTSEETSFNLLQSVNRPKWLFEEFDQKSALYKHMNKRTHCKPRSCHYHLYQHYGSFNLQDEDAMDKEVAVKVKRQRRGKHDSDEITDTRDDVVNSSMPRSDTESEHSEQSSDDIPMQDEGHVSDLEDTDNAHIPKGMETRKWSEEDRRRKQMTSTHCDEKRLQIRRYDHVKGLKRDYGKVPTEMELVLEYTQQVAVTPASITRTKTHTIESEPRGSSLKSRYDTYPILLSFTHCGNKSILRVLRIILVILPEHPSETMVFHNEDGNPARANIKQALGYLKDGDGDGNSQHLRYQVNNRMLRHDLHLL
ncbi:hypothetical protein Tco_0460991 [Tanacetum coccineum]